MNLIYDLLMTVILGCVQVVLFIVNLVVAIVMGIGMAVIFIPVLLYSMWSESRATKDNDEPF